MVKNLAILSFSDLGSGEGASRPLEFPSDRIAFEIHGGYLDHTLIYANERRGTLDDFRMGPGQPCFRLSSWKDQLCD